MKEIIVEILRKGISFCVLAFLVGWGCVAAVRWLYIIPMDRNGVEVFSFDGVVSVIVLSVLYYMVYLLIRAVFVVVDWCFDNLFSGYE